jgi:hypothetical protein
MPINENFDLIPFNSDVGICLSLPTYRLGFVSLKVDQCELYALVSACVCSCGREGDCVGKRLRGLPAAVECEKCECPSSAALA